MYATVAKVRAERKVSESETAPEEDAYVRQAIRWVARRIDSWPGIGFEFAPRKATRYYNALVQETSWGTSYLESPRSYTELALGHPLLETSAVVDGLTNTLTLWDGTANGRASSDYYLYPRGETPCWTLRMLPESARSWSDYDSDPIEAIAVTGTWGYRTRYSTEGWLDSNDTVQDNPLSASATTLTVSDADGANARAETPRFSPGMLIQIGSGNAVEWCEILDISTNTLSLLRGQRGTTARQHAQGTAIYVWQPEPDIERAAVRWVSYLYSRRGEFTAKQIEGGFGGTITFPPDAPPEVANILNGFASDSPSDVDGWAAV